MIVPGRIHVFARHRRGLAALMLALACVGFATPLYATSVVKLSDQQLVRFSSIVAEGHVTGVHSDWNLDHNQIFTTVTIHVTNQIKGARPQTGVLTVKLLGGQVGDVVMELIDQPTFKVDEDVIVFIDATSPQYTPITGLFQGKLTVAADPTTGALNVIDRGVARDAFVRDISRIVTEQGGR